MFKNLNHLNQSENWQKEKKNNFDQGVFYILHEQFDYTKVSISIG